jgi:hypothetical protein
LTGKSPLSAVATLPITPREVLEARRAPWKSDSLRAAP